MNNYSNRADERNHSNDLLSQMLLEYLIRVYDRKHCYYNDLLDNFSHRLRYVNRDETIDNLDFFDIILERAKLEEFDEIYHELMLLIRSFNFNSR